MNNGYRNFIGYLIQFTFAIIGSILIVSCIEIRSVPEEKDGKEFGLARIELIKKINLKDANISLEFDFKPDFTSKRFLCRLKFPEIDRDEDFGESYEKIQKSIDGLRIRIVDVRAKEEILNVSHIYKERSKSIFSYLSSASGKIADIGSGRLKLKKNRKYKIYLTIPNTGKNKRELSHFLFGIGTAAYASW